MRQQRANRDPIPVARIKPHDRAARLRVAGADASVWARGRARAAARFSAATLRVAIPVALIGSMAVLSVWHTPDRYSRSNAEVERQLQSLEQLRRNLSRQLELMNRAREFNQLQLRTPMVMPSLKPYLSPIPAPTRTGIDK